MQESLAAILELTFGSGHRGPVAPRSAPSPSSRLLMECGTVIFLCYMESTSGGTSSRQGRPDRAAEFFDNWLARGANFDAPQVFLQEVR